MRPSWNDYFMLLAKIVSSRSTCNVVKVGCVLINDKQILSTGYNGSVPGYKHCSDFGDKFCYIKESEDILRYNFCLANHAEMNVIAQAAKTGVSVKDSVLYTTYSPCLSCMKSLLVAGIRKVYYEKRFLTGNTETDKQLDVYAKENFLIFEEYRVSMDYITKIKRDLGSLTSNTAV